MNASDVVTAIRRKHYKAAVVTEVVVDDPEYRRAHRAFLRDTFPGYGPWADVEDYGPEHKHILATHTPQRRIDVLLFESGVRTAVEVKVTRADYARESDAKRDPWRNLCHRFVYATPAGLLKPEEIPDGCGLWEVGTDQYGMPTVAVTKKAKLRRDPPALPEQVVIALAYRASRATPSPSEEA